MKKMELTDLAPEIIHRILKCLRSHDLAKTALVCRAWLEPSREIAWSSMTLHLGEDLPPTFAPCLLADTPRPTTIPRHVAGLVVDQSDLVAEEGDDDGQKEYVREWMRTVSTILNHFTSTTSTTLGCVELVQDAILGEEEGFSEWKQAMLRSCHGSRHSLIVQGIKARRIADVLPFVLGNNEVKFLGIGRVILELEPGSASTEIQDGSDNKNNHGVADDLSDSSPILPSLRHLSLFSETPALWEQIVPIILERAALSQLKMLVAVFTDNEPVRKLLRKAADTLISVGLKPSRAGESLFI